jgi:hypothetical protein
MKSLALFLPFLLIACGCSRRLDSSSYSTLVIDEKHRIGTNWPTLYRVPTSTGIFIDLRQLDFTSPYNNIRLPPDMIQITVGRSNVYTTYMLSRHTQTNFYVIDRSTIEPLRGPAFSGFKSGDKLEIHVGRSYPSSGKHEFADVWWSGYAQVE